MSGEEGKVEREKEKEEKVIRKAEELAIKGNYVRALRTIQHHLKHHPEASLAKEQEKIYSNRIEAQNQLRDYIKNETFPLAAKGKKFELKDGRVLGYEIYGHGAEESAPAAEPLENRKILLFFHGTPGSRLFFTDGMNEQARSQQVTVYLIERPGFGLSTPHHHRSLQTFAEDVKEFVTGLGLPKVSVLGYSAGGPYAAACAYHIPELVRSVVLISSPSPPETPHYYHGMSLINTVGGFLARNWSWGIKAAVHSEVSEIQHNPIQKLFANLTASGHGDGKAYINPEIERAFVVSAKEQYSRPDGTSAEVQDYRIFSSPWGFNLADLKKEIKFYIWYGTEDNGVVPSMGHFFESNLPNHVSTPVEHKGHLLFFEVWGEAIGKAFSE